MKAVVNLSLKPIVISTWIFVIPILVKEKSVADSNEETQTYLTYVSNLLQSLFSNFEVYFNNTMAYNAKGLYYHRAQISNKFNSSAVSNKGILACHGYSFEEFPDASVH